MGSYLPQRGHQVCPRRDRIEVLQQREEGYGARATVQSFVRVLRVADYGRRKEYDTGVPGVN